MVVPSPSAPMVVPSPSAPMVVPSPSAPMVVPSPSTTVPDTSSSIEVAAQTSLPQDFKEVQMYLDKLKNYSSDAQKMSETISNTAENYKKAYDEATSNLTKLSELATSKAAIAETASTKAETILNDISSKMTDIQAQVNSNNIVKNEITAKINEFRDINKNVSDKSIETSMNANNAKGSAEDARRTLASILPTAANNVVLKSVAVEGFTGFKTSVLEGYTPFTTPSNNKNAFDLENDLVSKINLFNTAYYGFLSGTKSQTELNTANAALTTSILNLQNYIDANINTGSKISDADFKTRHTALKTTSDQINTLRADLDMKMNEIIKAKEGVPMDYTIERDTAAYTTILWTALATSMLYLVFVKMD